MTTKEWLMRAWHIDKEIQSLLSEQDEAFRRCTSITSSIRDVVVDSTKDQHKDAALVYLAGYGEKIRKAVDNLYRTKNEILEAVNRVDNTTYRTLLCLRYLRFKTWEEIAVEMNYTWRHTHRIHSAALKEIKMA